MDSIRKLLHYFFGVPLVILEDTDGDTRLRVKRTNHLGKPYAEYYGISYSKKVHLLPDGFVRGLIYCNKWYEWPVKDMEIG